MANTRVILNPRAGNGQAADDTRELTRIHGWELLETAEAGDARRWAALARRAETEKIVAAGGDGTINGLLEIPAEDRPRLGILPCGTANDFVKLQCEHLTWADAVSAIEGDEFRRFDLAKVEGGQRGYFANAATGGISADLEEQLDDEVKRWWGRFAYFRVAAAILPLAQVYRVRVETGSESFEGNTMAMMVANGGHAGGMKLLPGADPTDHQLDVAVVKAESLREVSSLLAQYVRGQHEHSENFWMARAKNIRVTCDPEMSFIGDGELLGETPLSFEAVPGAIEICTPPDPVSNQV